MTGPPGREHLGHDRSRRLGAGEVDAAHHHPRGVAGVQVVADGVHRDEDRQRPAGRVGEAQLGEQPLRLAQGLARAVHVGEPTEHRAHPGGGREPLHGILHRELGPAVGDERAGRGALVERRRGAAGVEATGRRGEEDDAVLPGDDGCRERLGHALEDAHLGRQGLLAGGDDPGAGAPGERPRTALAGPGEAAHPVGEGTDAGLLVGPGHRGREHLVPRRGQLGHDVPPDEAPGPDDPGEGSRAGRGHARSRPSGPSRRSRTGR